MMMLRHKETGLVFPVLVMEKSLLFQDKYYHLLGSSGSKDLGDRQLEFKKPIYIPSVSTNHTTMIAKGFDVHVFNDWSVAGRRLGRGSLPYSHYLWLDTKGKEKHFDEVADPVSNEDWLKLLL
jgi:hypothetical protein